MWVWWQKLEEENEDCPTALDDSMEIWIVTGTALLDLHLYDAGLAHFDPADTNRVCRFYHGTDACCERSHLRVPVSPHL